MEKADPEKSEKSDKAEKKGTDSQGVPLGIGKLAKSAGLGTTGTVGVTGREVNLKYLNVPPVPPDKLRMLLNMELAGKLSTGKVAGRHPSRHLRLPAHQCSGRIKERSC